MRKFLGIAVIGMALAFAAPAKADTFVWPDPKGEFTMSFPDVWRMQTPDTPSTYLRIAGPIAEDLATCRMMVVEDGRSQIYPKYILHTANIPLLNEEFYKDQIAQYDNSRLLAWYAPAGLGSKGDGTAAQYVYSENGVPMYGMMIGSIYAEKRYVASCSAKLDMYDRYASLFGSILDSVELKSKYHPFAIGYYRDFLADPKLVQVRLKPGTLHKNSYVLYESKYNE